MNEGASRPRIRIGTAGWSIPRASACRLRADGTHLSRYASAFSCVEINSSFYRSHAAKTYARWASSTPADFRFALKVPRTITHEQCLRRPRLPLEQFLDETAALGDRRGPLLVQLPPSLTFEPAVVSRFFDCLRQRHAGPVVCEPRHDTWTSERADLLLRRYGVARVAADPPRSAGLEAPGGWPGMLYFRLHGSPRTYWSRYSTAFIDVLARQVTMAASSAEVWCIFDNTAAGAAFENAWELSGTMDR